MDTVLTDRLRWLAIAIAAAAAIGANTLGYPSTASAEPVWDVEDYDNCMDAYAGNQGEKSITDWKNANGYCCRRSGGVFIDDGYIGKCVAPAAEPNSQGSRQLPGNAQIPSDIANAPAVTQAPPRPIQVPPDIATAPIVTQAPE
jgi:hypothetical protein